MFVRARSFRPVAQSARRALSTGTQPSTSARPLFNSRNAVIGATTLAVTALAFSSERRRVHNDAQPNVRESVLDQKSLKEPIHKDGAIQAKEGKELVEEKQAEASQPSQGAFNEETGEINWDCPCLGGMADGPCGEQFKAAFSCFVFSEAEPKGVDCVDKFKIMQDCFREHPEIYGEEIDDDEDAPIEEASTQAAIDADVPSTPTSNHPDSHPASASQSTPSKA